MYTYKDNKVREYYRKKNENVCFRCTVKTCKARIETNDVIVVAEYGDMITLTKLAMLQLLRYELLANVVCERYILASVQDRSDCDETVCGEMATFTTSSNLRALCCAFNVTSCGFIDFTFALLLKMHLRFRGSFCAFTAQP